MRCGYWICELGNLRSVRSVGFRARASIILDVRSVRAVHSHNELFLLINMHCWLRLIVIERRPRHTTYMLTYRYRMHTVQANLLLQVPLAFASFRTNEKLIYFTKKYMLRLSASHSCAQENCNKNQPMILQFVLLLLHAAACIVLGEPISCRT